MHSFVLRPMTRFGFSIFSSGFYTHQHGRFLKQSVNGDLDAGHEGAAAEDAPFADNV